GETLATLYLHKASSRLFLMDLHGKAKQELKLPALGTVSALNGEWDGGELFFGYQSFTVPPCVYRVDLKKRTAEVWDRVAGDIDYAAYDVQQVTFNSKDKTAVTMFLAGKKGLARFGKNPTLLYGYGGFNLSQTPVFNTSRFLFLENGGL